MRTLIWLLSGLAVVSIGSTPAAGQTPPDPTQVGAKQPEDLHALHSRIDQLEADVKQLRDQAKPAGEAKADTSTAKKTDADPPADKRSKR